MKRLMLRTWTRIARMMDIVLMLMTPSLTYQAGGRQATSSTSSSQCRTPLALTTPIKTKTQGSFPLPSTQSEAGSISCILARILFSIMVMKAKRRGRHLIST
jgi:hypothetical protein